jgi:hypothetical protein
MMFTSRRKEAFRYIFNKPINCVFEIIEINGSVVASKIAYAKLIDLSKNGCRIEMKLNLNCRTNLIKIRLILNFTDKAIPAVGHLRWQQSSLSYHSYGILFETSNDLGAAIIEELKVFTKDSKNSPKVG